MTHAQFVRAVFEAEQHTGLSMQEQIAALASSGAARHMTPEKALIGVLLEKQYELAKFAIESGVSPDSKVSAQGYAPLHLLAADGEPGMIEFVLQHKADANIRDHSGNTPLMVLAGAKKCVASCADLLLSHGAAIDATNNRHETALAWAVRYNNATLTQKLVENGCDTNIPDVQGATPLFCGAHAGATACVAQLLRCVGAVVDAPLHDGTTPLFIAASRGHLPIVELLCARGASVDGTSRVDGCTPLFAAANDSRDYRIVRHLLRAGANPNKTDSSGVTPLGYVASAGDANTEIMRELICAGANPTYVAVSHGGTILMSSVARHDREAVLLLLAADVDVNQRASDDGETALHTAAQCGDLAIIALLLAAGARTDVVSRREQTPYDLALLRAARKLGKPLDRVVEIADGEDEALELLTFCGGTSRAALVSVSSTQDVAAHRNTKYGAMLAAAREEIADARMRLLAARAANKSNLLLAAACEVCKMATKFSCSACRRAFYCSRACQKTAWKQHKSECKPLKQDATLS